VRYLYFKKGTQNENTIPFKAKQADGTNMTNLHELKYKAAFEFENWKTDFMRFTAKEVTYQMFLREDWFSKVGALINWRDKNPLITVRESKKGFFEKQSVEKWMEMFLMAKKETFFSRIRMYPQAHG
jgi:hypothetical protein